MFVLDPDHPNKPTTLIVLICAQNFAIIAWLAMVARRKGTGSLRSDFGLQVRPTGGGLVLRRPVASSSGSGCSCVALIPIGILESIYGHTAKQDVVKTADHATGWQIPVLALAIVLLAPLTEELLFRGHVAALVAAQGRAGERGADQRGRVRARPRARRSVGGDGHRHARDHPARRRARDRQAAQTGNLSRSILLHVGFNALSVVFLFTN